MTLLLILAAAALLLYARARRGFASRVRSRLMRYARSESLLLAAPSGRPARVRDLRRLLLDRVALRLEQSRLPLRPQEYLGILGAAAATSALLGLAIRGVGGMIVLSAAAVVAVWAWPGRMIARRRAQFVAMLPGALASMAGALRAGQSLQQAVRIVSEEFPDPVGPEFGRVVRAMQLGESPRGAIQRLRMSMEVEEISYLEAAIALHQQTGADLGYLLDRITDALRTRMEAEAELRALTSQARLSGRVLMWMPVVLGGFMYIIDRDYGKTMFGTGVGRMILALSAALLLLGRFLIRRITEVF
mgnify:CR=1 FL=1